MNNKGQIDFPIITWVFIVFGLLLIAPVVLKVMNSVQDNMSPQLGNMSGGNIAQDNFNTVLNTATTFWDKVIIFAFAVAVLLLFISAFLIDTSPFWAILYIFVAFLTVLFAPNIIDSLENIYGSATFSEELNQLPMVDYLRTHFAVILVGIIVITGIIIYGKVALFGERSRA